jgi:hypothetical protein
MPNEETVRISVETPSAHHTSRDWLNTCRTLRQFVSVTAGKVPGQPLSSLSAPKLTDPREAASPFCSAARVSVAMPKGVHVACCPCILCVQSTRYRHQPLLVYASIRGFEHDTRAGAGERRRVCSTPVLPSTLQRPSEAVTLLVCGPQDILLWMHAHIRPEICEPRAVRTLHRVRPEV